MDPALLAYLPFIAWVIFAAATALAIFLGGLLSYHWFRFAMNTTVSLTALVVYGVIATLLVLTLLATILAL